MTSLFTEHSQLRQWANSLVVSSWKQTYFPAPEYSRILEDFNAKPPQCPWYAVTTTGLCVMLAVVILAVGIAVENRLVIGVFAVPLVLSFLALGMGQKSSWVLYSPADAD